jgi:hypothetical protein
MDNCSGNSLITLPQAPKSLTRSFSVQLCGRLPMNSCWSSLALLCKKKYVKKVVVMNKIYIFITYATVP